ncbi:MAG: glycosyltransferase family 2 protein [Solirubrobacteraceae bacterium]
MPSQKQMRAPQGPSLRRSVARRQRIIKLSVLMPAYNEDRTIVEAVRSVLEQDFPCPIELVVVDDGSSTPVAHLLEDVRDERLVVARRPVNRGKGAALRWGASLATGTHLVPFDADLEYDPADLVNMLAPVMAGRCDVVYGTRLFGFNTRYQSYVHGLSNRFFTHLANVLFNAYINDLHTCLKLMPVEMFSRFKLSETGFGLDTEITAQILHAGVRPFEVPVSYFSRSHAQGKKIRWTDGVKCMMILARCRRRNPRGEAGMKWSEPHYPPLTGTRAAPDPIDRSVNVVVAMGAVPDIGFGSHPRPLRATRQRAAEENPALDPAR